MMETGEVQKAKVVPLWFTIAKWFIIALNCCLIGLFAILGIVAIFNKFILIFAFICMILMSLLGIYAAYKENFILLILFFVLLVVRIIAIFLGYLHSGEDGKNGGDYVVLLLEFLALVACGAMLYDLHRAPRA